MRRTRKWAFVAQEATRLADLGLTPAEIAQRLEVDKSTVTRWMKAGKLRKTSVAPHRPQRRPNIGVRPKKSPGSWAAAVRKAYDLDATDEQLVTIAQSALALSLDPHASPQVRMTAAGRFQSLVRQLSLMPRAEEQPAAPVDTKKPVAPAKPPAERQAPRRPAVDPRKLLSVVPK